ncbi:NPCBM/NEW2 domain-containing protein [Actinoplanes derwentensis]|uniref:NPCBM/NEW2 domain-containing protein n=1 Tax=Actinoplanes derwentensis TaxID=113562 RepID=A0A1H1Y7C6_9ACTN|nr:NPCBM/NEW2 domain-containing protein [Actinoplanes derwentensis]GID86693.1 hypothetical protein Ade03nite_56170 [Actinoplanes derwentensis]SDT17322.1 NPCBM/NEW2 domain-containing protein [Actinoplanes derwentensis]
MNAVTKSRNAALFVFLFLVAALIAGVILYLAHSGADRTAVPLVIGCVLVAFVMAIAAVRIVMAFRRSAKMTEAGLPPSRLLHVLDLRQWLILLVGLSFVAVGTGAFTGVRVLSRSGEPVALTPLPVPTVVEPTPVEPTFTEPTFTEPPSPSLTEELSESPSVDPSLDPAPGSTKYLDNEDELEGYTEADAVAFAAKRYPRGITFYCRSASENAYQWNVAGFSQFQAVGGIDDNTENTFGKVVEFEFYDQDGRKLGKPVEVSMGRPKDITLSLAGVTSLRMTCSTRDSKTNEERNTNASLGDPVVILN